jgi:Rps23 Pro-64 3,4-dihydroxylase Tpa1-like proline 4-hydroxylase
MIAETTAELRVAPFRHTTRANLVCDETADLLLSWCENEAPWKLRIASFYEQWELHLDNNVLPLHLQAIVSDETVCRLMEVMLKPIAQRPLSLVEVTAHKLVPGQTIGVHNDYIGDEETHRLLIQVNRGWSVKNGGVLLLFGSAQPGDVRRAVKPSHRSGFAFEISPNSFHAVSRMVSGERYTLVYSFRVAAEK